MEVVTALTDLADEILLDLYRANLGAAGVSDPPGIALVALGGYGRRELAPYSDIDLMFLYAPHHEQKVGALSTAILHTLWDLGFQVGHSLRTIADCREMGSADLTVRTALMEARWLAGDRELFVELAQDYRAEVSGKNVQAYVAQKLEERRQEYSRYGSTNLLLEPNLKKGRGGLRDLHLLKWTALARYGTSSFGELTAGGLLSAGDATVLWEAQEFLWRVRNDLHFYAVRAQDILTFDEQIRIAGLRGFKDMPHLLAVEQYFALTRDDITVPSDLRTEALSDGGRILRLFHLAQMYGLNVADDLVQELPERIAALPDAAFRSDAARRWFLSILSGPGRVADTLAAMHRVCLLERLIPAFGTVRGLMQFNAYHKYTVDQHSLLAVGQAEALGAENGLVGRVYREIKRKDLLHLAVLLHDVGKGQEEDHSLIGERIALGVADLLGLGEHETQMLVFLVRQHLVMSNTAFRRDSSDEKVVLRFARQVGTPEALKMLLALTSADISAVGPGMMTPWKESLLGDLFMKTHKELAGGEETETAYEGGARAKETRQSALARLEHRYPSAWLTRQLEAWPDHYLAAMPVERLVTHLEWLAKLADAPALVDVQYDQALGTSDYTVYTKDGLTPGIFSKIAGVLAAKGVQILDAQILTLADGVVVDVFRVMDPDCPEDVRDRRFMEISGAIVGVLEARYSVEELLQEATRFGQARQGVPLREPTVVQVDNETSDRYTIIDVFADDRQGLLYVITRAIFNLGLSVHAARISTKLDQVVDVFYVTDRTGGKIADLGRCKLISEEITARIEGFLGESQATRQMVHRAGAQRK